MLQAVGEADVLNLELLVNAPPFPELDDDGLGDGEFAEYSHVSPEAVRQHIGVTAVVLGLPCFAADLRLSLQAQGELACGVCGSTTKPVGTCVTATH
jgi:hypothetical protein